MQCTDFLFILRYNCTRERNDAHLSKWFYVRNKTMQLAYAIVTVILITVLTATPCGGAGPKKSAPKSGISPTDKGDLERIIEEYRIKNDDRETSAPGNDESGGDGGIKYFSVRPIDLLRFYPQRPERRG